MLKLDSILSELGHFLKVFDFIYLDIGRKSHVFSGCIEMAIIMINQCFFQQCLVERAIANLFACYYDIIFHSTTRMSNQLFSYLWLFTKISFCLPTKGVITLTK